MRKLILVVFVFTSVLLSSKSLPVDKETYLFKTDSINYIGSGYSNSAIPNKDSITVNPAGLTGLESSYFTLGYNYYDSKTLNYYINEEENILKGKISYLAVSSKQGGVFLRRLAFGDTEYVKAKYSEGAEHKYNLELYELGISFAEKSETAQGLSTGLTGKIYAGSMLEAGGDEIIVDRAYGFGFDLGMIYKKDYISTSMVFKDILGNIYWSDYDRVKVNTSMNLGIALISKYVRYSFAMDKIFLDTASMTFGQGVEFNVLNFPEEYSSYMVKGLKAIVRMGTYGDEIFNGNKYTYGLELSNDKYLINMATVGDSFGDVWAENNIYKFSIGMKF